MKLLHSELAHVKKNYFFSNFFMKPSHSKWPKWIFCQCVWYGTRWIKLENLIIFYLLAKKLYYVTKNCVFLLCVTPGAYVYLVRGWAVPNFERVGKGGNPATRLPLSKTHFRTFQATRTIREQSRFLRPSSFWGQILRFQKFSRSWS